jgi:hypothetical protein
MERKQVATAVRVIAGVMLLLALGSWEYSFYQLLRIVVCGASAFLAWHLFENKQTGWAWAFVVLAVVFNPVAPIYLAKETWQMIDFAAAILFFSSFSAETKVK